MTIKHSILFLGLLIVSLGMPSILRAQNKKVSSADYLKQIRQQINVYHNFTKAYDLTKSAITDYPRDVDFQFILGDLYFLRKDTAKGIRKMDEIIQKVPSYRDAYLKAASVALARKNSSKSIAYLNKGLERFPADNQMLKSKLNIYAADMDYVNGDKQAELLLEHYNKDSAALQAYVNYHNEAGQYYLKIGDFNQATRQFNLASAVQPSNPQSMAGNLSAVMRQGNDENSLAFVKRMLLAAPNSQELWMKKLGLLEEMRRYPEAIETLEEMQKKFPGNAKFAQMHQELQLEAARYYKKTDPYNEYVSVLEKSPGNREALNNVISIAISRNNNTEALLWINKALNYSPLDRDLLTKKMSILENLGKYDQAAQIAGTLLGSNPTSGNTEVFIDLNLKRARDFSAQGLYDSAVMVYNNILLVDPTQSIALNSALNLLILQKRYPEAISMADRAIRSYPNDVNLPIKRAGIYQQMGDYQTAVDQLGVLESAHPENPVIRGALVENLLALAKPMMEAMDYDQAKRIYEKVQALDPGNKDVLNSLINIELAEGDPGSARALSWSDTALHYFPQDQGFLLKKSQALFQLQRHQEALAISDSLSRRYPYNTLIRDAYKDQLTQTGTYLNRTGDTLAATAAWERLRSVRPKDSLALLSLINLKSSSQDFPGALALADTALGFYPDNAVFLMKKAAALASMKRYEQAADVAATLSKHNSDNPKYQDYALYLKSKTYKHQLGFSFLSSHYDSSQTANIATLQYSHLGEKLTLTGKLNFAGRSVGTGLQLEMEAYLKHGPKWYSYGDLAIANKVVFPRWKAAYSLFHNFADSWEAELGARILNLDSLTSFSAVASLGHYFGDFWTNLRGYGSFLSGKQYTAVTLTGRQYLNNKTDFFSATLGYGNSPDDVSRLYDFNQNLKFTTYSIGAGYQKVFNYRNTISINGTWYNQKIAEGRFKNQYDIFLTFFRNF